MLIFGRDVCSAPNRAGFSESENVQFLEIRCSFVDLLTRRGVCAPTLLLELVLTQQLRAAYRQPGMLVNVCFVRLPL